MNMKKFLYFLFVMSIVMGLNACSPDDDSVNTPPMELPENSDELGQHTIIVAVPLWWSNMAAPLQIFLFNHGVEMAGKRIGLIVSSASSGISNVELDAKRLIPNGIFLTPSFWIRSS